MGRRNGERGAKSRGRGGERKTRKNIYGINSAITMRSVNCRSEKSGGLGYLGGSSGSWCCWRGESAPQSGNPASGEGFETSTAARYKEILSGNYSPFFGSELRKTQ